MNPDYLPVIAIGLAAIGILLIVDWYEHRELREYEEFTEGGPVYVYSDEDEL